MPKREKPTNQESTPLRLPPQNPATKMRLWICVGGVSIIILVMWGWATSISLSSFSWAKTPEKKLIENSKKDWNELFNNEQEKIKNEQLKLQMKHILNTIIAEANTTTATTSTMSTSTINSSTPTTSSHQ
jgi:hypothetical protein